jgi:sterol 24-C-methyltransferase
MGVLNGPIIVAILAYWFMNGNPTMQVGKLFKMCKDGIAGGEGVDKFASIFTGVKSNDQFDAYDADVANSFYNLASEFYEYGWGDSFHFGYRQIHEGHGHSIANSQNFLAQQLHVGDMDRVLDIGCGIGGPMRGVVRRTGANVTGITINKYQIARGEEITAGLSQWMQDRCHFVNQDYLDIKGMEENAYDAAFYMESSLHCEDRSKTFKEAFKLLKPGGRLVAMEYVLLDGWDPEDEHQQEMMRINLIGNGSAKYPTIEEDLQFFRDAGFEVKEHFDFANLGEKIHGETHFPWWGDLQMNWGFKLLPAHPWVRNVLPYILKPLASIGLIPADVPKAAELMNIGADGISELGRLKAITPEYYVLAIKPLDA